MNQSLGRQLAGMDDVQAVAAFRRILAERPDARAELVRTLRTELLDLYAKWLDGPTG